MVDKPCKLCSGEWTTEPVYTSDNQMKNLNLCNKHYSRWRSAHCRGTA